MKSLQLEPGETLNDALLRAADYPAFTDPFSCLSEPFRLGTLARRKLGLLAPKDRKPPSDCPYPDNGTVRHQRSAWMRGWFQEDATIQA